MSQTKQQIEQIVLKWESTAPIENLAQTNWNIHKIAHYVMSHGGIFTVSLLNQAVAAMRTELDWLGQAPGEAPGPASTPAPASPATPKGTIAERLWRVGYAVDPRPSHADREVEDRRIENKWDSVRDNVAVMKQRHELVKALFEAKNAVVTYERGPRCGAINHGASQDLQKKQTAEIMQQIEAFNRRNPGNTIDI